MIRGKDSLTDNVFSPECTWAMAKINSVVTFVEVIDV